MTIWGTGSLRREFLHVDDMAQACYFLMQEYEQPEILNVGLGNDHTIAEMATISKEIVGFEGKLFFDDSNPDGTQRKLPNLDRVHPLGWTAEIDLKDGIRGTCQDFVNRYDYYIHKK